MTLDALDQAFVDRWRSQALATDVTPTDDPAALAAASSDIAASPSPMNQAEPTRPNSSARPADSITHDAPLVARLLESAAAQWNQLADEVTTARLAGHRVIAVTGGERGEGRTTLVACLATVLQGRGRDVTICGPHELATCHEGVVGGGQLHDKRIVLVDAGIWFPPGPIRRERLLVASLGCDAAILVRRADRDPAHAWAAALAAVGVEPLGEVVTFAAAHGEAPA